MLDCIYLASQSPRRRELLRQIHVRFEPLLFCGSYSGDAETDETPLPHEAPRPYVERLALDKAHTGFRRLRLRHLPVRPVLAADTTLEVDGRIVGKPASHEEAGTILHRLSGRSHRVLTAIAVTNGKHTAHATSESTVHFRPLSAGEIRAYVASGEPMGKAGAYGIQGRAAIFIEKIHGSYSGIMGLPLCETSLLLREFGVPVLK